MHEPDESWAIQDGRAASHRHGRSEGSVRITWGMREAEGLINNTDVFIPFLVLKRPCWEVYVERSIYIYSEWYQTRLSEGGQCAREKIRTDQMCDQAYTNARQHMISIVSVCSR